jgi:hypothetical protein
VHNFQFSVAQVSVEFGITDYPVMFTFAAQGATDKLKLKIALRVHVDHVIVQPEVALNESPDNQKIPVSLIQSTTGVHIH